MMGGSLHMSYGVLILLVLSSSSLLISAEDEEATVETERIVMDAEPDVEEEIDITYVTPGHPPKAYLAANFDDVNAFNSKWVKSKAKKDGVEAELAKYDGVWSVEAPEKDQLAGDLGLVLKSKAKHAAISVALVKPFRFTDKPLIVQYEVNLQNGQECGGAYIKLLSHELSGVDLVNFNDKTPYTIMFGPDKCGNDFKVHFIFRHVNPLTKEIEEKHAKRPTNKIEEPFKDKRPHLYTLIINIDNTFEMRLDHEVINSGNLLEDFTPPVNPQKEINDPKDYKPKDWDEREKIVDESSSKPEDWDEDAPMQIEDPSAVKPDGWLDDEPEMSPDPDAIKQDDWDDDMDGEWEAPLISNPVCADASGCGEWKPPMIDNPEYKGKWKAPMIDNPGYQGKWSPRRIQNPDYFEDLEPYKMTPFSAVGIELWSMSDGILFDNLLITDSETEAYQYAEETFDLKVAKIDHGQAGVFKRILNYSNKRPWLYGIYVVLVAIPVVLFFACCCAEDSKAKEAAEKKKTDEATEDDPAPAEKVDNASEEGEGEGEEEEEDDGGGGGGEGGEGEDAEEEEEEDNNQQTSEEKAPVEKIPAEEIIVETNARTSPRLRKSRKE